MGTDPLIAGCGTALVTPFADDGTVDFEVFRRLVSWQIEEGIDFLVPCGTTGETPTLNEQEYRRIIETCVEVAAGRVPVVAGAGGNSTAAVCELARRAGELGADAVLSVAPYYNKPTQRGLIEHFSAVAAAAPCPVVLYNVPGRTGINIEPETVLQLARLKNIVAVKEASGNLPQIMEIASARPQGFSLLSGDDNLALAVTLLGGDGLISVASNVIPRAMTQMIRAARASNIEAARRMHFRFLKLMNLHFIESSPIPVKYVLSRLGKITANYRLPLHPPSPATRERLDQEILQLELLKQ